MDKFKIIPTLGVFCAAVAFSLGACSTPPGGSSNAEPSASQSGRMELLRTPDARFENLPDYDFEPRYLFVDDPTGPPGNGRIRIHYAVSGPSDGPTLLMLHGNPSWSFLFRKIIPKINSPGYRTIIFDYVGHGRSDKPASEQDYSYDRHLEWIRQIVAKLDADQELDLGRMVLFGHDYGHPFGARLQAEHYPERFDGFINGNAGLNRGRYGISPRHEQWRNFVRSVETVPIGAIVCRNRARRSLGIAPCSTDEEAGYQAPYPSAEYQASIRAFPEMVPEGSSRPEAQANQRAWDYLTTYDRPYMVIWENWDLPDTRNRRDEYISSIPGAYGLNQPQFKTGHYSPEDAPDEVARVIIEFLDEIYNPNKFREAVSSSFENGLTVFDCSEIGCAYDSDTEAIALKSFDGPATMQSPPLDLSEANELKVAFRFLPESTAAGDKLYVEVWDGANWSSVVAMERGSELGQGQFFNRSTDYGYARVGRDDVNFASEARIRLRFEGSASDGRILVKDLAVYIR